MGGLSCNRASGIPPTDKPRQNTVEYTGANKRVSPATVVMSRRSTFEIIADILRLGQASRTTILSSSSINVVSLDKYLSLLTEQGLLTITRKRNHKIYHTTKRGEVLLHQIDDIYRTLGK